MEIVHKNKVIYIIQLLFITFLLFRSSPVMCSGMQSLYYVRLNVVSENNMVSTTKLDILPAENEYRFQKFKHIRIKARSEENSMVDPVSSAKHNAISTILTHYGLKSIKSRQRLVNTTSNDTVVLCYEGVMRAPIKIFNQEYSMDDASYTMDVEIFFSPIPFPDRWSLLYIKSLIKQYLFDLKSLFI